MARADFPWGRAVRATSLWIGILAVLVLGVWLRIRLDGQTHFFRVYLPPAPMWQRVLAWSMILVAPTALVGAHWLLKRAR